MKSKTESLQFRFVDVLLVTGWGCKRGCFAMRGVWFEKTPLRMSNLGFSIKWLDPLPQIDPRDPFPRMSCFGPRDPWTDNRRESPLGSTQNTINKTDWSDWN